MKKNDVFPKPWWNAADLNGKPIELTIAKAEYENLKNHKGVEERKLVVSFQKTRKRLVCNITNFDTIVEATGEPDSDDWPTHRIVLFPDEVQVGAEMKACVRVRGAQQPDLSLKQEPVEETPPPPAKADPDLNDEIPWK